MQCAACFTPVPADSENLFCEECGAELIASAAAGTAPDSQAGSAAVCACGASLLERDEDGFCMRCGKKNRLALATDHMEEEFSPRFASVTDRGLRHDRNEDRCGICAGPAGYGLVVCDGVSSSRASEIASAAVVEGVLQALTAALADETLEDPEQIMRQAVAAGISRLDAQMHLETRRTSSRSSSSHRTSSRKMRRLEENPPSTTVVAALVADGTVTVGWLGDSRAYWLDSQGAWPLTHDHSWQNDVVSAGIMTAEEAAKSPKAHAITRWIGMDSADTLPEIVSREASQPGTLLLCTDGLWNYAATPEELAHLVKSEAGQGTALEVARHFVEFALQRGGQDNVTVALLRTQDPPAFSEISDKPNPAKQTEVS